MMRTFSKHALAFLLSAPIFISLCTPVARAGFAVSPLKQEITVKPGEPGRFSITLSNHSRSGNEVAQAIHAAIMDVQVAPNGALIFKAPGTAEHSASKWITLSTTEVTLDPGANKTLDFAVNPPLATPPGEYYSTILITLDNKVRNERGMLIEYRIASGVFVTIPGRTFPRQAKITRCELLWPPIPAAAAQLPTDAQPPALLLTLHNTGQARFDATGKMALFDEKSRLVFAGPLNTKRPCVFGGDQRLFETPLDKPIPPGKYTAKITLDYQSWAPLRKNLPVEISPDQANFLAILKAHQPDAIGVAAAPEKITVSVPARGTRSLALAVKNVADLAVHFNVALFPTDAPSADSWITLATTDCTVLKGGRKTVAFSLHVPAGTKPGKYSSTITLEGCPEGADPSTLLVPVEVDVQSEK
jgi:hypothetical protein